MGQAHIKSNNFDLRDAMLNVPMCTTCSLRQGLKSFLEPSITSESDFPPTHTENPLYYDGVTPQFPTFT